MRKLLAALLGALPITTSAASTLDAGAFQLALSDDWVREQSSDPEQFSLRSKKESVHLTLSYTRMKAPSSRLEEVARKVVEFRLGAEQRAAAEHDLHLTIAEPIVVPFQQGFQVAYFGQDNRGRVFRYLGLVVPTKVVNLYAESSSRTTGELEAVLNTMLKGLKL